MQLNFARHVLKQRKSVKKKKEIQQNLLELQNIQSAVLLQQLILSYLRHNLHIRNFFLHTKMCNYQLSHWSQPLEAGNYRLPLLAEKKSMSYIQTKREKHSGCVFFRGAVAYPLCCTRHHKHKAAHRQDVVSGCGRELVCW